MSEESVVSISERVTEPAAAQAPAALSTGSLRLDLATGGYPRGRLVELFGRESSGKTSLALQAAAGVQRQGGVVAFIDADHALDAAHAQTLGVDAQRLLCSQPGSGEEALEICELLVRSNAVDLIIIDSVAALVPQTELLAGIGEAGSDGQVRLLEQGLRRLSSLTARSRCCLLFLNQLRIRGGDHPGGQMTTAGGDALKLHAALRIELRRLGCLTHQGEPCGLQIQARVLKNKLAAPYARADLELDFRCGVDRCSEIFALALQEGLIRGQEATPAAADDRIGEPRPAYGEGGYRLGGHVLGADRLSALAFLRERADLQRALEYRLCLQLQRGR